MYTYVKAYTVFIIIIPTETPEYDTSYDKTSHMLAHKLERFLLFSLYLKISTTWLLLTCIWVSKINAFDQNIYSYDKYEGKVIFDYILKLCNLEVASTFFLSLNKYSWKKKVIRFERSKSNKNVMIFAPCWSKIDQYLWNTKVLGS